MPRGDGTGPMGHGIGIGIGIARGMKTGTGRGRMKGNKAGSGPAGCCVCPKCGYKLLHQRGKPCYKMICHKCGAPMTRA